MRWSSTRIATANTALTAVTITRNPSADPPGPASARPTAPSIQICAPVSTGYSNAVSR